MKSWAPGWHRPRVSNPADFRNCRPAVTLRKGATSGALLFSGFLRALDVVFSVIDALVRLIRQLEAPMVPQEDTTGLDLCLSVIEQHRSDQDKAEGPDPSGNLPSGVGKAQLKPAGPTCGHSKDREGNMAQFHEEFFLDVA
jgi:hypothetical protein